jgi:hypothetical protein
MLIVYLTCPALCFLFSLHQWHHWLESDSDPGNSQFVAPKFPSTFPLAAEQMYQL